MLDIKDVDIRLEYQIQSWIPWLVVRLGLYAQIRFFFLFLMQLGWIESLDNLKLLWGHIFKDLFKVVVSNSY
jgi:hypothetical protein